MGGGRRLVGRDRAGGGWRRRRRSRVRGAGVPRGRRRAPGAARDGAGALSQAAQPAQADDQYHDPSPQHDGDEPIGGHSAPLWIKRPREAALPTPLGQGHRSTLGGTSGAAVRGKSMVTADFFSWVERTEVRCGKPAQGLTGYGVTECIYLPQLK